MTIGDIKIILSNIPKDMTIEEFDELPLLIPVNGQFDGLFYSPCIVETGISDLSVEEEDENKTYPAFTLVPCGFFEQHDRPELLN